MNSNLHQTTHFEICTRCREKPASMECCECDTKGLKLCFNCDIAMHEFSFRNTHLRNLIKSQQHQNQLIAHTPRLQTMKQQGCDSIKGSVTPRIRMQVDNKAKGSENKENKVRNNSLGPNKKNETKVALLSQKNENIKPIPEDSNAIILAKYQEIINKKDQVIESMRSTIDSLNSQMSQAQETLKQTQAQYVEMKNSFTENATKIKYKMTLEEKRGPSLNHRGINTSAECKDQNNTDRNPFDKQEDTALKEQLNSQTKAYKLKFEVLSKEKDRQLDYIKTIKNMLELEEDSHKKTKEKLKAAQKEIATLRKAIYKTPKCSD